LHRYTAFETTESNEPVHSGSLKVVMADAIQRWFVVGLYKWNAVDPSI
jgi:hypothetical protein